MIQYPNITGHSPAMAQVRTALYMMVDQLNNALKQTGTVKSTEASAQTAKGSGAESQATFNSIKSLIIKSADIVNAYYDQINKRLEGVYAAEAHFPEGSAIFIEKTTQDIKANAQALEQAFSDIQTVLSNMQTLHNTQIETNAHIKSGLLYEENGVPVYGLEVGQRTEADGVEIFHKYARFTASRLTFYDSYGNEAAYVSDRKLYITHVHVTGSFQQGGFKDEVLADGGSVTKWVGMEG